MRDQSITDQQALVDKLLGQGAATKKILIPGGKTMLKTLDKDDIEGAVYNWLRGCNGFTAVKISYAKDPSKYVTNVTKVHGFEGRDPRPYWDRTPDGIKKLATEIAKFITTRVFVAIEAKHEGIFLHEDNQKRFKPTVDDKDGNKVPNPDWEPYVEFQPSSKRKYTAYAVPE